MQNDKHAVIFFDGVCNLCNAGVQYIIKRDHKAFFQFCPLQSSTSEAFMNHHGFKTTNNTTIILYYNRKFYIRSSAILHIIKNLDGPVRILYTFILIPPLIRNLIYNIIANSRYHWFGKKENCMAPGPDISRRFLDPV